MSISEQRLEALEIKLMDLEQSVADLNDVIIRQYQIIDTLKSSHEKLVYQMENPDPGTQDSMPDPPPPHY